MVGIMTMKKQMTPNWWWLDSHSNAKRSPWLQSTLSELDEKTKDMLKLIEEDADSFAKRAEMYYKKRPELISMVEDLYRAHRSLAERYDQVKSETHPRLLASLSSPFSGKKSGQEKPAMSKDTIHRKSISCYEFETSDYDESAESEVEDEDSDEDGGSRAPEWEMPRVPGARAAVTNQVLDMNKHEDVQELSSRVSVTVNRIGRGKEDQVTELREEIERLREENRVQRELLEQKDEEKRATIRQLSSAVEMLKEENAGLRKSAIRVTSRRRDSSEVRDEKKKVNGDLLRKLFGGSFLKSQATVVAL